MASRQEPLYTPAEYLALERAAETKHEYFDGRIYAMSGAEVDVLLNPTVLVEVLSKSTEAYDRGGKFDQYRKIPTLQEYVLFAQDRALAEHYLRAGAAGDRWGLTVVRGLDAALELPAIGCTLPLRAVYERVELLPDPPLRAVYEDALDAGYAVNQTST